MTPDGRFVAFADMLGSSSGKLYVWASDVRYEGIHQQYQIGIKTVAISPDGNRIVYWAGATTVQLFAADRAAGTSWTILPSSPAFHAGSALQRRQSLPNHAAT